MFLNKPLTRVLIAALLILILAPAAWADSDSDSDSDSDAVSIVGSWDVVFALPSGDAPGFFTFDSGETWFATGSQASLSPAHGAWEQTGSRTFAATNKGFIYATDGSISLLIKNSGILEVSPDGDSFTAAFLTEISIPGGPVVSSFSGTATGTRIQVD